MPKATSQLDPSKCPPNVLHRFWNLVDRSGECWTWKGAKHPKGYGSFTPYTACTLGAHRFIDIALNGIHQPGECTLHKCDNPACVRPSHLFRGTKADNNHDRSAKGRYNGTMNPKAKLTNEQVHDIRARREKGATLQAIANHYGLTNPTVHAIVTRKTWKHVLAAIDHQQEGTPMAAIELRMNSQHAATFLTLIDQYDAADQDARNKPWKSSPIARRDELARDIADTLCAMRRLTDDAHGTIYATATVHDLMR